MPICRFLLWRILFLCTISIVSYYTLVRHTRTVSRIRYKANDIPLYECPNSERTQKLEYNGNIGKNVRQRILLIKDPSSEIHIRIVDYLNYFKLPIRIETADYGNLLDDVGRFSLIIFSNHSNYENLSNQSRIQKYAEKFHVGIISFALSNCEEILCYPRQQAFNLKFNQNSPIPFIAKSNVSIAIPNFELHDWTFLTGTDWNSVLETEDENGDIRNVIIHKRGPIEFVIIGHDLTNWPINLAFLDILNYFLGSQITGGLTRYVQIDIDDIFVAQAGTRLLKEDIGELIKNQDSLRLLIDNFSFTLGFSGFYFGHGDQLETKGDEQLISDASKFLWFPHTYKHNHVHEYSAENLTLIMQLNKEFSKEKQLNVSLNYAVSPQHSGIYPIHDALYDTWKDVWDVKVISTEEYPHFASASKRQGFIYKNISVLPRQTCGLFTHTLYFHALPEGLKNHQDSIFGGALFKSLLLNQFSIFMTHQQNFGNDRLGSYTFLNLFRFMRCHTNLQFKWITPSNLANKYFERFPDERQLFYTDVCADSRHLRSLPLNQTCKNVNRLPNTIIVGPQKTGTTALREFLLLHPNVSSNRDLGIGYFEEAQFFGGSNYFRGVEWYRQLFNLTTKDTTLIFEKSANYFDNPKTPKAIHYLIPNAKIIILLVDPIERAFSWYQHMKAHSDPTALKYSAMDIFSGAIDTIEVRKLRNRCLQPGLYAKHLEKWLDFFEPRQLVVLDGWELRNNPIKVMNLLIPALGLPHSIDYEKLLKFDSQKGFYCINNNGSTKCLGKGKGRKYEAMSSELRQLLEKTFEEPNRSLLEILNHYKLKIPSFLSSNN